jgi:hypothetical protein
VPAGVQNLSGLPDQLGECAVLVECQPRLATELTDGLGRATEQRGDLRHGETTVDAQEIRSGGPGRAQLTDLTG